MSPNMMSPPQRIMIIPPPRIGPMLLMSFCPPSSPAAAQGFCVLTDHFYANGNTT
jgi:hypothetical protein